MTATFLLPLAQGAALALGGSAADAFGVVAMVAMTPLITIQALGLIYKFKSKKTSVEVPITTSIIDMFKTYENNEIIEL